VCAYDFAIKMAWKWTSLQQESELNPPCIEINLFLRHRCERICLETPTKWAEPDSDWFWFVLEADLLLYELTTYCLNVLMLIYAKIACFV